MDQKYKQLNERFQELQELYEVRPPRPEDLELIKKLQAEIEQKDAAIKKAAEDMKFYKLELINREESYNNMFGRTPNVGVMNPMTTGKNAAKGAPVGGLPPMAPGGPPGIGGMSMGLTGKGAPVGPPKTNMGQRKTNQVM